MFIAIVDDHPGLREAIGRGRVEGALNLPDWVSVAAAYQEIYEQVSCG